MQSAFNIAPPHTSPRAITAAELVAGIVLGMVLVGGSICVSSGLILLEAPRLIAFSSA